MAARLPVVEPVPLTQRITTGLTKIHLALRSRSWKSTSTRGTAPAQSQLLLRSRPHRTTTASDIAEHFTVTPGSASHALRGLTQQELVRKPRSGLDARRVTLPVTAKGRRRADRTMTSSDFLAHAAETLPVQDQETLLGTLPKVLRTLQERGEIPDVRMRPTCRHFRPNIHVDPDQPHHCAALDAPFENKQLRGECPAHRPAASEQPPTSRPARTRRDELTLPSRSRLL